MQFLSTRGMAPRASFSDVLLAGLAPDGGLYLPENWPHASGNFKAARYQDAAFQILSEFTRGSFSDAELRAAIDAAYAGFDVPAIAPLVEIGDGRYLLELF